MHEIAEFKGKFPKELAELLTLLLILSKQFT
jgi:hypothetical protein